MKTNKPKTIAAYVNAFPAASQKNLREMYALLKKAAPGSKEAIKWGCPVFEYHRILYAFAGFKAHLSLMPTPAVVRLFKSELAPYKTGMGSIQFPYDKPLPKTLIRKIAHRRVKQLKENDARWM